MSGSISIPLSILGFTSSQNSDQADITLPEEHQGKQNMDVNTEKIGYEHKGFKVWIDGYKDVLD